MYSKRNNFNENLAVLRKCKNLILIRSAIYKGLLCNPMYYFSYFKTLLAQGMKCCILGPSVCPPSCCRQAR